MANKFCWANVLGDCAGAITGEHLISKATFRGAKTINIQGFDWCLDKKVTIGINAITSNILCKGHNNALSEIDTAGAKFISTVEEIFAKEERRKLVAGLGWPWHVVDHDVDGLLLDRWMLKTVINVATLRNLPIGAPDAPPGRPTRELVEIAFGRRRFSGSAGFYAAPVMRDTTSAARVEDLTFIWLDHNDPAPWVAGAFVILGDMRFAVALTERGLPPNIGDVIEGWRGAILIPSREAITIKFNLDDRLSQQLVLRWPPR